MTLGTGDEWDFTAPDDDAELRRLGVRPGVRLHQVVSEQDSAADRSPIERPEFFGSPSAASDLGERTREILLAELPHGR